MAIQTGRFQVAIATLQEANKGGVAILVDTATGRSWLCIQFGLEVGSRQWHPLKFAADAPAAPGTRPKRKTSAKPPISKR